MKTRWKILVGGGIVLLLLAASLLISGHYQPASALEAYKKSLRDQGEKLELSEVLPPSVPDASNCVEAVRAAFGSLGSGPEKVPYAMLGVAPGKAMIGWAQPEARNFDFTNSWEEFTPEMEADRPMLDFLQQALTKPKLDFHLDYKQGATLLLPHLAPLKRSSQKLEADAICLLHDGNPGAALTNILTMLALEQKSVSDPLLISHLVRLAITAIAVAPTWEVLQTTNITGAQLADLQTGWEKLDFLGDATNVFVMERAWSINQLQKLRGSDAEYKKLRGAYASLMGGGSSAGGWDWEALTEDARNALGETMWRSSWSYDDELETIKANTAILKTLRTLQTNRSEQYKTNLDALLAELAALKKTNSFRAFCRSLEITDGLSEMSEELSLGNAVRKTVRAEAARRIVVTAIALKRFQLQHGNWPETIAELAPAFLSAIPVDPFDGQPLRYHPNGDGTFLLYSVGADGVDDGGDASQPATASFYSSYGWMNDKARDWVWPQPASAAEIQNYFDEQAKKAK